MTKSNLIDNGICTPNQNPSKFNISVRSNYLLNSSLFRLPLLSCLILMFVCNTESAIYKINPSKDFNPIQKAYQQSKSGDTILLSKGTYNVSRFVISKKITLLSNENAILNGGNKGTILIIKSDSVTISGLTIANTGKSYIDDYSAILSESSKFLTIRKCTFMNCFFAIYLKKSTDCLIEYNKIIGRAISEANSGNAIHLWNCKRMYIYNNIVAKHRDGIYLEFTEDSKIMYNKSYNNLRYGLHFMFSHNTTYISNLFKHNGAGVAVMFSKHINMYKNRFIENKGSASYGLLLKEIKDGTISGNLFSKNTIGIYAEGTSNMMIKENNFEYNGWAVKMVSSCYDNTITLNNFKINSFEFTTNSSRFNSKIVKNYWSGYSGYDLNKDGIGDVAHKPMSLYSYLVQKSPEAILLIRSLFMNIMDLLEKIAPTVTPSYLSDEQPLMEEIKR